MRVLAVDTSSERGSVCVAQDTQVLGEVRIASSIQYSERLFRSIEFLFHYLPFELADIDLFVAARGPGSFTGLRVGLAAMEAFAAAHGKPGAGVSTLEALAWKCGPKKQWIAPVIDARRGEVYAAIYRREDIGTLIEIQSPSVMTPERWFASLPDQEIVFCGDGVLRYPNYISRSKWNVADVDLYLATALAELAV